MTSQSGYNSDMELQSFSTLLKMIAIAGILLLGCFSACLGSITITLVRLRYDHVVHDLESGRMDRKSYKRDIQSKDPRAHSHSHKHSKHSKSRALAIASQACDAALRHLEERIDMRPRAGVSGAPLSQHDAIIEIQPSAPPVSVVGEVDWPCQSVRPKVDWQDQSAIRPEVETRMPPDVDRSRANQGKNE